MEAVKLGFLIAYCASLGVTLSGRAEASPVGRTMAALEASTAERPARVRMLFYGQSIVEQGWHTNIVRRLKERYPTAQLEVENRAIGGFTSPDLIRTAESDLYPFYPDILFFHVYGPLDKYEAIVRKVRETTTAEIVLWSSHLNRSESADRATVEKSMAGHPDARTCGIREIAERYGCLFVDLRRCWGETMLAKGWTAKDLLADGVHMKRTSPAFALYSDTIADVLMGEPKGTVPAFSGDIEEIPLSDKRVTKGADGSLTLDFDGNRVVAVSDGTGSVPVRVGLDGRAPATFPEMFYTTRPSKFVSWMPMIKHVDFEKESRPVEEDWALTFVPGTRALGDPIHYMVVGSKTGFDGEGWNTNDFRSVSGRALVSKFDFHTWQYGHFVKKGGNKAVDSRPGQKVTWSTRGLFADPYRAPRLAGERTTLVQFCANGPHRLTLCPEGNGKVGVSRFIVYRPTRREPIRIAVGPQERVKTPPVKFGAGVRAASDKQPEPADLQTPPAVRIDILVDKLPEGVTALATEFERCYLLASQKGRRIVGIGEVEPPPDDGAWERYRFAFVPTCDITATLALSGQFGKKTEYRTVRVTGATADREVSGLANHNNRKTCKVVLKKDEKVTVEFEARADPADLGK